MLTCPHCATPQPDTSATCATCGYPLDTSDATTALAEGSESAPSSPLPLTALGAGTGAGRYTPGTLLADRYRIVGLLGRGGMGEVYRADDLVLGQAVALKFLPFVLERDPQRLQRFLTEVSHARQVAHPNVCRVYDVGTIGGQHFYSMEYVDGEDLSSLLRRIGRLPPDKGLEIARQLCAALGAVHEKSLLHRDLKPANVMLDGRGKVRLTDFGLAAAATATGDARGITGTPAYMSPEQLAGAPATVQSDLYALGLVLYEVFTGRRLFDSPTIDGLKAQHDEFRPTDLSSTTVELGPAIERAIERCLEKDPRSRPASAFAVAAALPGGDPLAAALAAGETPSPELVAAAGQTTGLTPRHALIALGVLVVAVGALLVSRASTGLLAQGIAPLSPDVLANKAEEMLARLGYDAPPGDRAYQLWLDTDYVSYWREHDRSRGLWDRLAGHRSETIGFWYRASPADLVAERFRMGGLAPGRVTRHDPPDTEPGMVHVVLNPQGRLRSLHVVPDARDPEHAGAVAPFAWDRLFREAGLDAAGFAPAPFRWVPTTWGDQRAAWSGPDPADPTVSLHVEAASYRGKPTFFLIAGPWTQPAVAGGEPKRPGGRTRDAVSIAIVVTVLLGAVLLARQNIKLGRGDRRGALRLGLAVVALNLTGWLVTADHVAGVQALPMFLTALASALLAATLVWGVYMALEPHVRRHWPRALISWARLLSGRPADPLVGHDVVLGTVVGVLLALVNDVQVVVLRYAAPRAPVPVAPRLSALGGLGDMVGVVPAVIFDSVLGSLTVFLLLFLLLLVLRRTWLAGLAVVALIVANNVASGDFPVVDGVLAALVATGFVWLLTRFGLVSFVVAEFVAAILMGAPLSLDMSAWHWWATVSAFVVVGALAVYGFRAALAGGSLFGMEAGELS